MSRTINVEYKGYYAISSGSFIMGMGSVYIVKPNGRLLLHATLGVKPTRNFLQKYLKDVVDTKEQFLKVINEQGGEDGKRKESENPGNNQ